MCIALSESLKFDSSDSTQPQKKSAKPNQPCANSPYKIEKQHICIFTDEINIAHSTKTCQPNVQQLKYPTNFASFENLFQMSKSKDLITLNDPSIEKSLFSNGATNDNGQAAPMSNLLNASNTTLAAAAASNSNSLVVPMVSIGIKSKFNTKKNTKQLLVALNFRNLSLHHVFCSQEDFWIFQLIMLFDLIDIEIIGYEVPIVLTELHLNVTNSCVLYKPAYLPSRALIAFKSLHWSSNVTAESSLTLLVFNIEDIYLFLSKLSQAYSHTDLDTDSSRSINLQRDYICVANSDLFELRLLINDEHKQQDHQAATTKLKSPLLDIKIRSNLIQLRTCVDSAFALIELINYIVSDGDLHQPNLVMSEFMSSNPATQPAISLPSHSSKINLNEKQSAQTLADEMISAINNELHNEHNTGSTGSSTDVSRGFAAAGNALSMQQPISSSIPIQKKASFTVGTPPTTSSFSFKSTSSSFNQQIFYSPHKSNSSFSPASQHMSTAASSFQDKRILAPLPSPSLSFGLKAAGSNAAFNSNVGNMSLASGGGFSSAESLIR